MEAVADHRAVGVRAVVVSHLGQELRLATRGHGGTRSPAVVQRLAGPACAAASGNRLSQHRRGSLVVRSSFGAPQTGLGKEGSGHERAAGCLPKLESLSSQPGSQGTGHSRTVAHVGEPADEATAPVDFPLATRNA